MYLVETAAAYETFWSLPLLAHAGACATNDDLLLCIAPSERAPEAVHRPLSSSSVHHPSIMRPRAPCSDILANYSACTAPEGCYRSLSDLKWAVGAVASPPRPASRHTPRRWVFEACYLDDKGIDSFYLFYFIFLDHLYTARRFYCLIACCATSRLTGRALNLHTHTRTPPLSAPQGSMDPRAAHSPPAFTRHHHLPARPRNMYSP